MAGACGPQSIPEGVGTARERIVLDPQAMRGPPVIKGTRLLVRMLHALVRGGDSIDAVLEECPYLDRGTVAAAVLFVEANRLRGRSRRRAAIRP